MIATIPRMNAAICPVDKFVSQAGRKLLPVDPVEDVAVPVTGNDDVPLLELASELTGVDA
jgi:hypothetical protein